MSARAPAASSPWVAAPPQPARAGKYGHAAARWVGVGPYYAMFPAAFADCVIECYTRPGDLVLDPFAGRGTALFSAATRGRRAVGFEINPVGWVYAKTKLAPADPNAVLARLTEIGRQADADGAFRAAAAGLPEYFHLAFCPRVRAFLLAARASLEWERDATDRTLVAFLLVDLHGKCTAALSNQMRQTKAMAPDYAVRWWRERPEFAAPPERDPVAFVRKKIAWRYARGRPHVSPGCEVHLGDCAERLATWRPAEGARVQLLFTSPPYLGVTDYHYDQWLRLWLLGRGPERPAPKAERPTHCARFRDVPAYRELLRGVFLRAARHLAAEGTVYVRTDQRDLTLDVTRAALREAFPGHRMREVNHRFASSTQTGLFGGRAGVRTAAGGGEVDLILSPS